ncbi:MAG: sigma factor-like helix-turn-helix DNA-binding protein, partial [Acidobacteriota bacterium]
AVHSLPIIYRQIILLDIYENYTAAEIATIVGLEVAAVKSRLLRGREHLRKLIAEYYS